MIGIFGLRRKDSQAPAELDCFAATLDKRYQVNAPNGRGGSVGYASHADGFPAVRARTQDRSVEAVVTGAIFNLADFASEAPDLTSAAELILHLYLKDQLGRFREVNGQFAAAIYDKAHHRLLLVTDRLATTAIHIWQQDGELVFATHLFTLLGDQRIARRSNPEAIAQLFTMQRTIGDTTPIKNVLALPAGCIATFDASGEKKSRYWELNWHEDGSSEDDTAEKIAVALRNAVARQSTGPRTGLLLSGGLDSRLIIAAAPAGHLSCWTTASYEGNPELEIARRIANMFASEHHALIVDPAETLNVNDDTVVESGGLYPASTPMSAFLPRAGAGCDVLLTGHGLDYTLRGYYLPTRFVQISGSRGRLPMLKPIPARATGKDVLESLRQGPPLSTVQRIVKAGKADEWWGHQAEGMDRILRPWLDSDEPYNAWDAFILHAVNKHYAFTGMMATRAVADMALPAFDNELFDIYLTLSPKARVSGRHVHKALRRLSPEAARMPNANTFFRADMHHWLELAALYGRAVLRRLRLAHRPALPSRSHSAGSWQNLSHLYRDDPAHRQRFIEIQSRLDGMTCGMLDASALRDCIEEHLNGSRTHVKLLRQMLTHDAWIRRFEINN